MQWEPALYLILLLVASMGLYWFSTRRGIPLLRLISVYSTAISAFFWMSSSVAGPAEWSDLQPFFEAGLVPLAAVTICWYCSRIGSPPLRVLMTLSSALVALLSGVLLLSLLIMETLEVRRGHPIYSPNGRHAVIIRSFGMSDGLDDSVATVAVRRTWLPHSTIGFQGWAHLAESPLKISPQVRWLDSSRLLIRLVDYPPQHKHFCAPQIGEITILCESVTSQ